MLKILYLFNKTKKMSTSHVQGGREADNHFFGMFRLQKYGIIADYLEIEQSFFSSVAPLLRKYLLNIHFAHLPLFFRVCKYDIVFTSTAFGTFLIKVLFKLKKPKWVMFDFNIEEIIGGRKTIRQKIFYYLVSKSDGIITISESAANTMRRMFPEKERTITFIPLGTDTVFFKPTEDSEENFILCPGRDPGRDYVTLFDAVKDLPIEIKVTAKTEHLKKVGVLALNIKQYDFSPLELRDQYARTKIVVIPLKATSASNNAMGCSTLVEAMAMGKAVVATDTQTMRSYIKNGVNGILVPPNDSYKLKVVLEKLLTDEVERKRLGENARVFAIEECSAEKFAKKLAVFFSKL